MKAALKKAFNQNIFTIDSDLENVKVSEIESGMEKFLTSDADEAIFQVFTTKAKLDGLLNRYISFSGIRLIRKNDLKEVLKENIKGYQLETAINKYFSENHKKSYFVKCSFINPNKLDKIGFLKGMQNNIKMEISMISYTGVWEHIKQTLFFARKELK